MLRLAHLTDTHIDGTTDRRDRLVRALGEAGTRGAQHLLLTGDLTAHGRSDEMQELSWILNRWPRTATVVGGNHDGPEFAWHLSGTLNRFVATSTPGRAFVLGDVTVVPVATYFENRAILFRALGSVGREQFSVLENIASSTQQPVVVAMHHGPQLDPLRAFAGLIDRHRIDGLLRANPHVSVCCGHDHRVLDAGQVHVAASCATHPDPLRIYDVSPGRFDSVHCSSCEGSYFGEAVCPLPEHP
jgi:3',5'-cyclic AMP phosphodiesterase CpdA